MKKFNGDIRIENDIWEALTKYRIPGEQMQCLLFIIRQTVGYNKEKTNISFPKFVEATGINKGNIGRALRKLCEKKVVVKKDNNTGVSYRFNKKYRTWKSLSKKTTGSPKRQQTLSKKTPPPIINNKQFSVYIRRANKVFDFYLEKTNPTLITKAGAIQNIQHYLKEEKYSTKKLMNAITNYSSVSGNHKKDPINFFGIEGKDNKYFESYLPENFRHQKKKKEFVVGKETYQTIISYLNEKAGTNYKYTTVVTKKHIKARLAEGFTENDFITVIDNKAAEWLNDKKMHKFLRPETLFGSKFESYLQKVNKFNPKPNLKTKIGVNKTGAHVYEEKDELTLSV